MPGSKHASTKVVTPSTQVEQTTIPGALEFLEQCEAGHRTLTGEQLTAEFSQPSKRRLDRGKKPITESPLFGGDSQGSLFE